MSPDEYFAMFQEKYGNDFNWMLTSSDSFAHELENEHSFDSITVIAKCESNDDVLFLIDGIYRICHLTYSGKAEPLKSLEFSDLSDAMEYIEKDYVKNYL